MGRKLVKKITDSQELLLMYLWQKHGGPVAVSRLCGVGMQRPNNWRMRGRVPLDIIRRVSIGTGESMWALNYAGMAQMTDKKDRPSWISVVDSCGLPPGARNEIVFMKSPVVVD